MLTFVVFAKISLLPKILLPKKVVLLCLCVVVSSTSGLSTTTTTTPPSPLAAAAQGRVDNLLFADQQAAMARQAEREHSLFEGSERELSIPRAVVQAPKKVKRGSGFASSQPSGAQKETAARVKVLEKEGVVRLDQSMDPSTARKLREAILREIAEAREAVAANPATAMSRFHAREEQRLRSFVLLPLHEAAFVDATRQLLDKERPLGLLYEALCGLDGVLYDFYGLRTEPGSYRQPIHFDTPFQPTPPLYASFVALQDVTLAMGPTHFLPGTHLQTTERLAFDDGLIDGRRDAMLKAARPKYALLKAGDLVIFDMRVLHFGAANQPEDGATRIFLNLTFKNPKASDADLGHVPCIRPGFVEAFTLRDIRAQLNSDEPFASFGDGLPAFNFNPPV